jgi:hypothetical protein
MVVAIARMLPRCPCCARRFPETCGEIYDAVVLITRYLGPGDSKISGEAALGNYTSRGVNRFTAPTMLARPV